MIYDIYIVVGVFNTYKICNNPQYNLYSIIKYDHIFLTSTVHMP